MRIAAAAGRRGRTSSPGNRRIYRRTRRATLRMDEACADATIGYTRDPFRSWGAGAAVRDLRVSFQRRRRLRRGRPCPTRIRPHRRAKTRPITATTVGTAIRAATADSPRAVGVAATTKTPERAETLGMPARPTQGSLFRSRGPPPGDQEAHQEAPQEADQDHQSRLTAPAPAHLADLGRRPTRHVYRVKSQA